MVSAVAGLLSLALMTATWSVVASQGTDQQCTVNKDTFRPDAQVRFAFMSSLRKSDPSASSGQTSACALISKESLQNYLTAEWLVERLNNANNGSGYIPGVIIGFDGLDDCRSAVYASRNAMSFVDYWIPGALKNCSKSSAANILNIGIIGPTRSSTATRVASLMRDVKVPIISPAATSVELSNNSNYPTFLRTVPSDDIQMNLIANLAKQLSWSYIAIAYTNDEYGVSGAKLLKQKAEKLGICIQKMIQVSSKSIVELSRNLTELLQNVKDSSVGLVFIGGKDDAEQLFFTIDNNVLGKFGFHVILSDASNTETDIYSNKKFGFGTLAIATSDLILEDVLADLQEKFRRVKSKQEQHNLIEEYIRGYPTEDLFPEKSHNSFLPNFVHAIFALIQSLKDKHTENCSGMRGICQRLKTAIDQGSLVDAVFHVNVDYGKMDRGIPPNKFKDNNYQVSFEENGDMKQVNNMPTYIVYQYQDKLYKQVGSYVNNELLMNMSKIQMLNPDGSLSSTLPRSVCTGRCDDCLNEGKIPLAFMEGDAYILGVFSAHEPNSDDPFKCGAFRAVANDVIAAEGFFFAIKELRALTNINFGAIAIDDCYSPLRSISILSDYLSGLVASDGNLFPLQIPRDKLVGVVACRSSGCTIQTASLLMPLNLPVISYSSSSPDLDDRVQYPYFLRTVPSDVFQAKVMLNIVKTMKWEYVGLMYVRNNYGSKAMKAFKTLASAEDSGVCVAEEIGIGEKISDYDDAEFFKAWSQLVTQQVKVVVFFGIDVRYRTFLKYLEEGNRYGKFIFIGSEDWGNNDYILQEGPKSARGSITLKVEAITLESDAAFRNYLAAKSPSSNDTNIWFSEFWQNIFECNFKGGLINTFKRDCDPSWQLSSEVLDKRLNEQRLKQTMNAVYAMGMGLNEARKELCEGSFPCKYLRQYVGKVLEKIKQQSRLQGTLRYPVFDKDGNGAIGFDVYNIQQTGSNQYGYVKVGTFNSKDSILETDAIKFYGETGTPVKEIISQCTPTLCGHCPKRTPADIPSPVTSNSKMDDFRQPDILIISLLVVIILTVAVGFAIIYLCNLQNYRFIKKKLEAKNDQIYAEPDTPYQPYGIQFANAGMDPYIGFENAPNQTLRGTTNPSYIHDNVDSISQVVAMKPAHRMSQTDFRNRSTNLRKSLTNSQVSSRPLPVSPIGNETMSEIMHDNLAYQESPSEHNMPGSSFFRSATTSSQVAYGSSVNSTNGDTMTPRRSIDNQSTSNLHVIIPASSLNMSSINGRPQLSEGVVYFMKNSTSQGPVSSSQSPPRQVLSQQASIRSNRSSINAQNGPYSFAAAQQRQRELQLNTSPQDIRNGNVSLREMNMRNTNLSQQNTASMPVALQPQQNMSQFSSDNQGAYIPIHYASTLVSSPQTVGSQPINTTQFHQEFNETSPMHIKNVDDPDLTYAKQLRDMQIQDNPQAPLVLHLESTRRGSGPHYENSMASEAQDTEGQTTPAPDLQQQISLESVDLSTLDDVQMEPQFVGNNRQGFGLVRSFLEGTFTNV